MQHGLESSFVVQQRRGRQQQQSLGLQGDFADGHEVIALLAVFRGGSRRRDMVRLVDDEHSLLFGKTLHCFEIVVSGHVDGVVEQAAEVEFVRNSSCHCLTRCGGTRIKTR